MAAIERRLRNGKARWYVRYRDPSGVQRTKPFDRKVDAARYLTTTEASKLTGAYLDPVLASLTIGEWTKRWLEGTGPPQAVHLRAVCRDSARARLTAGAEREACRRVPCRRPDLDHDLVDARKAATVRKIHRVLSLILALAVKDGRLVRNPANGVNLPRVVKDERRFLTHEQVDALATACARPTDVSKHRHLDEGLSV